MRVTSPGVDLEVEFDKVVARDGMIIMTGMIGVWDCEAQLSPGEFLRLGVKSLRPSVLSTCLAHLARVLLRRPRKEGR